MEVRVGFEPTVELLCRQLPWTTRPPHYDLLTLAPEAGHDPATFGLTDRRYYQLSYSGTEPLFLPFCGTKLSTNLANL